MRSCRRQQDVAAGLLPLLGRDGPVLDADRLAAGQGMRPGHDVAGAEDVGVADGRQRRVALEPGVELQPAVRPATPCSAARPSRRRRGRRGCASRRSARPPRPGRRRAARRRPCRRRRSTPWSRCRAAHHSPSCGPSGSIGVGAMSIRVTSRPCLRAVWATSQPMKPAPTTTTRGRRSSAARSASASSRLRRTWTPSSSPPGPGQRRALDPVARISRSYGELVAVGEHDAPAGAVEPRRRHAQAPLRVEACPTGAGRVPPRARRPAAPSTAAAACTAGGLVAHHDQLAVEPSGSRGLRRPQPGERRPDDDHSTHLALLRSTIGKLKSV